MLRGKKYEKNSDSENPGTGSLHGYDDLLSSVGTPTTYFVDSKGKLIGNPILGASPEKYREKMEEYLSKDE